jgi:hypothetical protein
MACTARLVFITHESCQFGMVVEHMVMISDGREAGSAVKALANK